MTTGLRYSEDYADPDTDVWIYSAAGNPYTIVHSTQFMEFLAGIAQSILIEGKVHLSPAFVQPIASDDVAEAMADVALGNPVNGLIEIAGPERFRLSPRDAWSTVFVTEDGRPAFSDADGPAAQIVVVRSDIVEHFCNLNGLKPVWRVWVEKDGGGEGAKTSGVFERHDYIGFYICENGTWRGRMIPFRQPTR